MKKIIILTVLLFGTLFYLYIKIDPAIIRGLYYYLCKSEKTIMSHGKQLDIDLESLHKADPAYGEWLVHPSVKYIPQGFAGHKWWMVVTPYPKWNNKYEQPVLYYGNTNDDSPPQKWEYVGLVQQGHETGYNADPNIYFDGEKLWIVWKEHNTPNTIGEYTNNCIMVNSYDGNKFGKPRRILQNNDSIDVRLTAPILVEINDTLKLLATDFEHPRTSGIQPFGKNELAVWYLENNDFEYGNFVYQYSKKQDYPELFNYWHADIFKIDDSKYLSVVTPESGNQILFGMSNNGESFSYISKPLLSTRGNCLQNLYKACPVVVNNTMYLFYPASSGLCKGNRKSLIYCSSIELNQLNSIYNEYILKEDFNSK